MVGMVHMANRWPNTVYIARTVCMANAVYGPFASSPEPGHAVTRAS